MANPWSLTLKNLFFPIFCKMCGRRLLSEENPCFCPTCWEQSPRVERPFCNVCGEPQQGRAGFGALQNFPCAKCRKEPPRHCRRIHAAAIYEGAIAEAIRLFKFSERRRLAPVLGEVLRQFIVQEMDVERYSLIVPVPLHGVRQRERGYNQSELLAREIEDLFPEATVSEALSRTRPTRVQSRLHAPEERRANVAGAFAVRDDARLEGRSVLLVDDVVTSGGTIEECARMLRGGGAAEVDVIAVALPIDLEVSRYGPAAR